MTTERHGSARTAEAEQRKEAYRILEEARNWLAWKDLATAGYDQPMRPAHEVVFGKAGTRGL